MTKIAFCTTCKDRVEHLSQTLPKNIYDRNGHRDSVFVVLDYNDQNGLADYITREHKKDLDSGVLVYYKTPEPGKFAMAHAKNMAHRAGLAEGAEILVNLDADNWTGNDFATYVGRRFEFAAENQEAIFLGVRSNKHFGPGHLVKTKNRQGTAGRIAVTKQAFYHTGGYDEIFAEWSPDDKDFGNRLRNLGYMWQNIRPDFLDAIRHGQKFRERYYANSDNDEAFLLRNRQHMRVVNDGKIGTGIVYKNFSSEPIQLGRLPTRIFGIGMHKTATTSLAQAFRILGYDTAHWESGNWAQNIYNEMKAEGRSRTLEGHYTVCDLPIPLLYRELDAGYPGSKFILTVRDEDEWLDSVRVHWTALRSSWDSDVFSHRAHELTYGTRDFDEPIFRAAYRRHNQSVVDYFRGRPQDLLVMNMSHGAGWRELCPFLDRQVLTSPFPRRHQSMKQEKYARAHQQLSSNQKE